MKDGFIKVAAATPQLRVADPAYNCEKMRELVGAASGKGVQILVFPELAITNDHPFVGTKLSRPHRPPGVQTIGAYTHHSSQAVITATGKTRGSIDQYRS